METVRLAGIVSQSITDGPGLRLTIFTQGCPHKCKGCHNPETWSFSGGKDYSIPSLLKMVDDNPLLKGVTLSGGEPLARAKELIPFAKGIKDRGKDIICYTGFVFEELLVSMEKNEELKELLSYIDVLIDGPFVLEERDISLRFRGSKNQRSIDLPKSLQKKEVVLMSENCGY